MSGPRQRSAAAWHDPAMDNPRPIETWLTDMDGVLVHEEDPIPGATEFIEALQGARARSSWC